MDWKDQLRVAEGFFEIGLHTDAFGEIDRIRPEDQTRPEIYALLLRIYLDRQQWDLAHSCASHLIRVTPQDPNPWVAKAEIVRRLHGEEASSVVFQEACAHFPEHGEVLYGIACAAARDGDVTRAKVYLASAIGYEPGLKARALDDDALRLVWADIENMG